MRDPLGLFDNFHEASKVVVGIACDFLGNWLSPVEFAHGYAKNRKVSKDKPQMSKHYHFEANLSLTGANADDATRTLEALERALVDARRLPVGVLLLALLSWGTRARERGLTAADVTNVHRLLAGVGW